MFSKIRKLLEADPSEVTSDEIHQAKSILYAAIERYSMGAELARELLHILTMHADLRADEQRLGLQILEELSENTSPKTKSSTV